MKTRHLFIFPILLALTLSVSLARPAQADCFDDASEYQQVNADVLRAIAWQESHGRSDAMHSNSNGSTDYGMMQINSIHLTSLSGYGISSERLMDPCVNVYVAAWHLRSKMQKYGNTWDAVGAYHSETPRERDKYKNSIMHIIAEKKYAKNLSR